MIRILIIDDEPSAANILLLLIKKHIAEPTEIAICTRPAEALELIPVFKPGLLMLDIEMPLMNGFDLLNRIDVCDFDVIFTTAFNQYAIKAIRFSALDYLLKPVDITELQSAIFRHSMNKSRQPQESKRLMGNFFNNLRQNNAASFKLALNTSDGLHFYDPDDIVRCEGDDNYTHFHFVKDKTLVVTKTLKEFEELLTEHGFVRAHKSHLVNIRQVVRMDKEGILWLKNGTQIMVSRRKRAEVLKMLMAGNT